MKRILWLAAPFMLIAAGCVTTAPENVTPTPAKEQPKAAQEKAPETKIIDVYLPATETLVSSDGVTDGYTQYDYDSNGVLLEKRELDSEKKIINRMVNTVSGGLIVKTQWFRGENNDPGMYTVKKYNGDKLVEETSYDVKNVPQSVSAYEYDTAGNVIKWTVSSGDNVPMMVTEYKYDGSKRTEALFLTPLGQSEGKIEYNWDGNQKVSETTYDGDGNLDKKVEYQYDGGKLIGETHYKKTVVDFKIEYELDDQGNVKVKKQFYRSGNLKAQWNYTYISVKKEVRQ